MHAAIKKKPRSKPMLLESESGSEGEKGAGRSPRVACVSWNRGKSQEERKAADEGKASHSKESIIALCTFFHA